MGPYYCHFATKVIFDLSRLKGVWRILSDDMVELCYMYQLLILKESPGDLTFDAHVCAPLGVLRARLAEGEGRTDLKSFVIQSRLP